MKSENIFADYKAGMTKTELAKKYGRSVTAISFAIAKEERDEALREHYPELASLDWETRKSFVKKGVHSVEDARAMLNRIAAGEKIDGVGTSFLKKLEMFVGESAHLTYISNAFSLQMLDLEAKAALTVTPVDAEEVASVPDLISVVGHADTAAVLSDMLDKEIAFNRVSLRLEAGDILYVAQIVGGRLPEGSTTLPEGFKITFVRVDLK